MQKLSLTNKYASYPNYKDSDVDWIGTIPDTWQSTRAKNIFKRNSRPVRDEDEVVTAFRNGIVTLRKNRRVDGFTFAEQEIGYQGVRKGDLVIHGMDAFAGAIGVSDSDGKSSPVYAVCTPRVDADSRFHMYLLRHMSKTGYLTAIARGIRERSTEFKWNQYGHMVVINPGKEEQEKIVRFLDEQTNRIDEIITKKEQLIKLLKEKRITVIIHAVTKGLKPDMELVESGLPWIGRIPKHWSLQVNKSIFKKKKYLVGSNYNEFQMLSLSKQGIIVRDVESGKGKFSVDMSTYQKVEQGDLVFCLFDIEETPRTVGLSDVSGMITGAYSVFHCNHLILSKFIEYFYVAMDEGKRLSYLYSGLRNTISPPRFLRIPTPVPPENELEEIVNYLNLKTESITKAIKKVESSIMLLKEHKSSLISHAVTGKIKI